jgi:hypothetical protein
MSEKQRDLFAKGMVDLANIVAGALVFGQLVSGHAVHMSKMVLGIAFAGVFYMERSASPLRERCLQHIGPTTSTISAS